MFAYLGVDTRGPASHIKNKLSERINNIISENEVKSLIGEWEVVWGPCVFQPLFSKTPANVMYVSRNKQANSYTKQPPEYIVTIGGTYPSSIYAYLETFQVARQVKWKTLNPKVICDAKISKGMAKGIKQLMKMKCSLNSASQLSLAQFLEKEISIKGTEIIVAGHSLGAGLASLLSSWLLNTQSSWDPNGLSTVKTYTFAGGTIGNPDFANYLTNHQLKGNITRVWNQLDIGPYIWNRDLLKNLPTLYVPNIEPNIAIKALCRLFIILTNRKDYMHIKEDAKPITGSKFNHTPDFNEKYPVNQYFSQAKYQHIEAYFKLLETMEIWRIMKHIFKSDKLKKSNELNEKVLSFTNAGLNSTP